ncbi:MAG: hypothetical protein ACRCVJ_08895 [Clostridium sp.]|uniref:hypothetical protein n=1 Tax=Clostridium sp. TaxID=1506 RepID=UPI003F2B255B
MDRMKIYIDIKVDSFVEKCLFVKIKICGMRSGFTNLYVGKISPFDIKCNLKYKEKNNFIEVNKLDNSHLELEYKVKIGKLAKHGHSGEMNNDILVFQGEQVFILPVEILSLKDMKDNTCEIISVNIKSLKKVIQIPFYNGDILLKEANIGWSDIYKIMKDSYVFGEFNECFKRDKMKIICENGVRLKEDIKENIYNLYKYYCGLFKDNKELKVVVLNNSKEDNKGVICGCVGDSICASFDFNNIRDWQLLSHRMFHNFMDYKIKSKVFHITPNLWLTEGLATYYEIYALESLSLKLKETLGVNSEEEFKKLFLRYLYMKFKNRDLLEIAPMEEGSLRSLGKVEFLHYTVAPLIIKYIEDIIYKKRKERDTIITYISNLNYENRFSMEKLFSFLLGKEKDSFAMAFLFNSEIIPLWYLSDGMEEEKEIVNSINEYDYILWSWFQREGINYERSIVSHEDVKEGYEKMANRLNVNFSNKLYENMVKKASYTIYILLKKYYLGIYI